MMVIKGSAKNLDNNNVFMSSFLSAEKVNEKGISLSILEFNWTGRCHVIHESHINYDTIIISRT